MQHPSLQADVPPSTVAHFIGRMPRL